MKSKLGIGQNQRVKFEMVQPLEALKISAREDRPEPLNRQTKPVNLKRSESHNVNTSFTSKLRVQMEQVHRQQKQMKTLQTSV